MIIELTNIRASIKVFLKLFKAKVKQYRVFSLYVETDLLPYTVQIVFSDPNMKLESIVKWPIFSCKDFVRIQAHHSQKSLNILSL